MIRVLLSLSMALVGGPAPSTDNWPEFRGPSSDGHSAATGLPVSWSETKNVKWKTAIHGKGWSTPAVWGKQIWLTTATEDGHEMFVVCVDRETGKVLLDRKLFTNASPEPLGNDVNSYASPSPAIEAGRVYVHFGSYGTACLDTKTFKTLWERRDLPCRHYRGPSSSPILFENLLILTFDGADYQYTAALNKKTGKTAWKTDRTANWNDLDASGKPTAEGDLRKAHSTPIITTVNGQPHMVSIGAKAGYGYDPQSGKELWKVDYSGFSSSMRPVVGFGMAFITTAFGRADLWALRLGGTGNITNSNVVWKYSRMVPSKPSPLLVGDLLYLANDSGVVTCLEAKTGNQVWQERVGGQFSASPIYADGRIYLFSEQGKATILKPGRTLSVIGENELSTGMMASPAVSGKSLILRTKTHLYRIQNAG
jgi:outer membrane protein assembly factor BamB